MGSSMRWAAFYLPDDRFAAAGLRRLEDAPVALTRNDAGNREACDTVRMARIEYAAQRAYTDVHWVSCPRLSAPG